MAMLATFKPVFFPARRRGGTIERAFELARSGECGTVAEIEKRLNAECYEDVYEHLNGLFTRTQLREAMARAGGAAERIRKEDRPC